MIVSLMLALGYLSSNFDVEQDEMESELREENQSKADCSFDVTSNQKMFPKGGRFPSFVRLRDKFAFFRMGATMSTYRRHLLEAENKIAMLANQCKAFREVAESSVEKGETMSHLHEAKLSEMTAAHKAELDALSGAKTLMEKNLENLHRTYASLAENGEKTTQQLKAAEINLKIQGNLNDVLSGKLQEAEQKKVNQKNEFDAKCAEQLATFNAKYAKQQAMFQTKYKQQEAMFDKKFAEQEVKSNKKHADQEAVFIKKFEKQQATFGEKYKAQEAIFNSKYAELQAMFDAKCKEQEATLDIKYTKQKVAFNKMLQNERRKIEALSEENETVTKRLKTTEAALLRSRQVKVTQEYEFNDTMNSVVPKDELKTIQEQCVLYKKMMSVLAALVLILVTVVFLGSRFLL